MDLERFTGRSYEFHPQGLVEVGYGNAASVGRNALIGSDGLYTCLGVVLLDEELVSLAHFPIEDRFWVVTDDERETGGVRTFDELIDFLFSQHELVSDTTAAVLVGGVEGQSEVLSSRVEEELIRRGVAQISHRGPHSEKVEWDLRVRQGIVSVSARRRHLKLTNTL